ncbi:DUF3500 domain-containing protein [Rudanella paleaurantiibacter]|uniref:DUF3500 domain-containing protein n=1 Tax=Rudanella paleaurantiibacter TaxID=2614655 RepID=A0A7J5TW13_9BACT|nr:DUF3500 domain-containing protein [Rudanella paleaurantiibacter]KAB7728627.1 DUF3500 domain-containing protein [Rudanella paleaurantiibacter]
MYAFRFLPFLWLLGPWAALAQSAASTANDAMREAARQFAQTLSAEQKQLAIFTFDHDERFVWHYTPVSRKGLSMKGMTEPQRRAALALLRTGLSDEGYRKALDIMDTENVLRVVENRPPNDTYRDPDNYFLTLFGDPEGTQPWGWRFEGHHLSVQFSSLTGQIMGATPLFLGSNPGEVRAEVPQKGRQILRRETELAFALLETLTPEQRQQAVLATRAYNDLVTGNRRRASLDRMDGLPLAQMTDRQRTLFLQLLQTYLANYRVTLAKQQLEKLEKANLDSLRFAWAGGLQPQLGTGENGWYYRIHGPTILIEYDNTQNNANHIHTVVRDLTNDFGEDMLRTHYEQRKH